LLILIDMGEQPNRAMEQMVWYELIGLASLKVLGALIRTRRSPGLAKPPRWTGTGSKPVLRGNPDAGQTLVDPSRRAERLGHEASTDLVIRPQAARDPPVTEKHWKTCRFRKNRRIR
jgi:hypothetical protein